jgi:hypothetical protein
MLIQNIFSRRGVAIFHAALILFSAYDSAAAEIDVDTAHKLSAIKSIALSSEPISPQQVARELAVELQTNCTPFDDPTEGKFQICNSAPVKDEKETAQLAFLHYSTVNRLTEHDTGGTVHFIAKNKAMCLSQEDLSKFFQVAAAPSSERILTEPALPYIQSRRYEFKFPKQGKFEVAISVLETGQCAAIIELSKTSYKTRTGK